jgi:NAD(P)H-quinone oxidoreductase subunit L
LKRGSLDVVVNLLDSRFFMILALLYLILSGAYLLVIPGLLYWYLNKRWYVASSFERAFMYFLVFFFFPGLLLLSPFLNFRPKLRQI